MLCKSHKARTRSITLGCSLSPLAMALHPIPPRPQRAIRLPASPPPVSSVPALALLCLETQPSGSHISTQHFVYSHTDSVLSSSPTISATSSLAPGTTQHASTSSGSQATTGSSAPTAASTTSAPNSEAGQLASSIALVMGVFAAVMFLS